MKAGLRISVLPALLFAMATVAYADTITLASNSGSSSSDANGKLEYLGYSSLGSQCSTFPCNTALTAPAVLTSSNGTLSSSSTSYAITNGVWAAAISGSSWVANTATAGTSCTGSQCDPNDFYYYQTTFTAKGGVEGYNGTISVMADDTAEVILDAGTANQVILVPFAIVGNDSQCATGNSGTGASPLPSCETVDTVTLNNIKLTATNTLTIIDAQTDLNGAGVDFTAQLVQAPEPPSLLLFGAGILGLAGLLRFKFRHSR